jgi:hypothetical protein
MNKLHDIVFCFEPNDPPHRIGWQGIDLPLRFGPDSTYKCQTAPTLTWRNKQGASMRSFFVIPMLMLSLNTNHALADDPPGTSQPGFSGFCSVDFLISYISTGREIEVLASYLTAKEPAPNLNEANRACTKLMTDFPEMACIVPRSFQYAQTSDFAKECEIVSKLYDESGLANQPLADLDATPLNRLDIKNLQMTVQDKTALDSLISQSRLAFAINGLVYDLSQLIDAASGPRCAIEADRTLKTLPEAGDSFEGQFVMENFVSGIRVSSIVINADFNLVCMNDNGRPVTYGDLKKAFGSIVKFTIR